MKNSPDPEKYPADDLPDLAADTDPYAKGDYPDPFMWDLYDEKVYKDTGKLVLLPGM